MLNAVEQLEKNQTEKGTKVHPFTNFSVILVFENVMTGFGIASVKNLVTTWRNFSTSHWNQLQICRFPSVGVDALSSFGTQFFESIDKLHTECVKSREDAVSELEQVKRESEEYQYELKELFPCKTQSEKSEEQRKKKYQQVGSASAK